MIPGKGKSTAPSKGNTAGLYAGQLADDAREALRTLVFIQKQIPANRRAKVFRSHHALPHRRRPDRRPRHHFYNLSGLKQVEGKLHETQQIANPQKNS